MLTSVEKIWKIWGVQVETIHTGRRRPCPTVAEVRGMA